MLDLGDRRLAVRSGLRDRGWTLASETPEVIVGRLRDGNREASVTITFGEKKLILIPAMDEIGPGDKRTPVEPHLRWHRNLKAAIQQRLLTGDVERVPDGDQIPIPAGLAPVIVRQAISTALLERGWTVTENTPTRLMGTIREGQKVSTVEITLSATEATITSRRYELATGDTQKPLEPNLRWHKNLKLSVFQQLQAAAKQFSLPTAPPASAAAPAPRRPSG